MEIQYPHDKYTSQPSYVKEVILLERLTFILTLRALYIFSASFIWQSLRGTKWRISCILWKYIIGINRQFI